MRRSRLHSALRQQTEGRLGLLNTSYKRAGGESVSLYISDRHGHIDILVPQSFFNVGCAEQIGSIMDLCKVRRLGHQGHFCRRKAPSDCKIHLAERCNAACVILSNIKSYWVILIATKEQKRLHKQFLSLPLLFPCLMQMPMPPLPLWLTVIGFVWASVMSSLRLCFCQVLKRGGGGGGGRKNHFDQ